MQFNKDAYTRYQEEINSALLELDVVLKLPHVECMEAIPGAMERFDRVNEPALRKLMAFKIDIDL